MISWYKQLASTNKLYPAIILYHIHKIRNVKCGYSILTGKLDTHLPRCYVLLKPVDYSTLTIQQMHMQYFYIF